MKNRVCVETGNRVCEKTLAILRCHWRRSRKCNRYWIYYKFDVHRCPLHPGSWPHVQGRFTPFTLVAFLILRDFPLSSDGCSVSSDQSMERVTISVVKMQHTLYSSSYIKRGFVLIFTHISSLLFIFLITLIVHSSLPLFLSLHLFFSFIINIVSGFIGFLLF